MINQQLASIVIGFSRPRTFSPISLLIRLFEGTKYSHVYLKWQSESERVIVFEADETSVRVLSQDAHNKLSQTMKAYELDVEKNVIKKLDYFAAINLGKPYGYFQLIGISIVKFFKFIGRKIKNPFGDGDKSFICSELVGVVLKKFILQHNLPGQEKEALSDLENLTPKSIDELLEELTRGGSVKRLF